MAKTFDLYKGDEVDQEDVETPVEITGLKPNTQYDDYALAYKGKKDKTPLSFKTKAQPVTGVSLDKTELSLEKGKTATLKAKIVPADATNKGVNWASDNDKVATVDSKGVVTAVATGTANIKVGTKDGDKSAQAKVIVKNPTVKVTGVSLNKETTTIDVGKTETLKAAVAPENASDKAVEFSSSDDKIATVGKKDGQVTAIKAGTADITVVTHEGAKKATTKVTVKTPVVPVTGITLDKKELSVEEGATAQLKAAVAPENATNKKVAWKSGNSETFTIDANGKITGVKAGSATAVATTDDQGKTAEATITVTAKPAESEAPAE